MAASAERQMNLAALQQRDPYITGIVDTASQVALYSFCTKTNEWQNTEKEGTLFVYSRSASPINGFMILNRLGLQDLIEPLNKNLEFQLQDPFLLYRNAKAAIYGIWFYDKDECARIGQLMNSLVQVAAETQENKDSAAGRQRRASESDSLYDRSQNDFLDSASGMTAPKSNVDILQMLSKAQDEYDKVSTQQSSPTQMEGQNHVLKKKVAAGGKKSEPKPMIDNPSAAATKSSSLIKPLPLKASQSENSELEEPVAVEAVTPNTQISLDQLFKRACSLQLDNQPQEQPKPIPVPGPNQPASQMPPILQRLMSNQGATLQEIERQQRWECPRDQMPQPAGAEAPSRATNGAVAPYIARPQSTEPESPNTALKRTLNILPQAPNDQRGEFTAAGSAAGPLPAHGQVNTAGFRGVDGGEGAPYLPPPSSFSQTAPTGLLRQSSVDSSQLAAKAPVIPSIGAPGGSTSRTGAGEGLITPQALLQTAAASLPSSTGATNQAHHPQAGASQLSLAASVLLSPMAFQSGSPSTQLLSSNVLPQSVSQGSGLNVINMSDTGSTHSVSPHDFSADNLFRSAEPPGITPLTREQFQQAYIYLLKNDSGFLTSLHEAYVKSLHQGLHARVDKL